MIDFKMPDNIGYLVQETMKISQIKTFNVPDNWSLNSHSHSDWNLYTSSGEFIAAYNNVPLIRGRLPHVKDIINFDSIDKTLEIVENQIIDHEAYQKIPLSNAKYAKLILIPLSVMACSIVTSLDGDNSKTLSVLLYGLALTFTGYWAGYTTNFLGKRDHGLNGLPKEALWWQYGKEIFHER